VENKKIERFPSEMSEEVSSFRPLELTQGMPQANYALLFSAIWWR